MKIAYVALFMMAVLGFLLVFVVVSGVPVFALSNNTVTFCQDSNTSVSIENYEVCGNSPVLNPANLFCQNYTQTRNELCASGCDFNTGTCIPPPVDRTFVLAVIFVGIIGFILVLARWY